MMRKEQVVRAVKETALTEARGETDTLRLWENYRDQAMMWRALTLLQIPTSVLLIICSIVLWTTRNVYLEVPAMPMPGTHLATDIPDTEFTEVATNFVNLIATYQPYTAKAQFNEAAKLIREPLLSRFDAEYIQIELKAIESTSRTQIFFADPTKTQTKRINDREVEVSFTGDRLKLVAGKELPVVNSRFTVTLTTVPRQYLNPYGIVITNLVFENEVRR